MSVADLLGFGPKRFIKDNKDGTYTVLVIPPFGGGGNSVTLDAAGKEGLDRWMHGALIQEALPQLSKVEREILQTGLNDAEFKKAVR